MLKVHADPTNQKEFSMKLSILSKAAALAAAMIAGSATPKPAQAQFGSEPPVKNIVLVHGAWADGSCWSQVILLLEAKGFHVVSVQNPLTSFPEDVAATQRALAALDGPAILVGHSYGGAVITQAGVDAKVAGLVYVSAYAPDAGESSVTVGANFPQSPLSGDLVLDSYGFFTISAKGIFEDFAQDLPLPERQLLLDTQGPTAKIALTAPVSAVAWRSKPSWFIVAAEDRAIPPALEMAEASKMKATTVTLQSGHLAMISHPLEVAATIEQAARNSRH
jgi:pimeloyl-ACP methyl ester carboxylesterase